MKKLTLTLLALAVALFGGTKLSLIDVRPLAGAPTLYLAGVSAGGWIPVALDPAGSVVIDTSVSPAVLRAVAAASATAQGEDDFVIAPGVTSFATSAIPKGRLDVYRNGLLERKGDDYQTSGAGLVTVSFIQPVAAGDYVSLLYQK